MGPPAYAMWQGLGLLPTRPGNPQTPTGPPLPPLLLRPAGDPPPQTRMRRKLWRCTACGLLVAVVVGLWILRQPRPQALLRAPAFWRAPCPLQSLWNQELSLLHGQRLRRRGPAWSPGSSPRCRPDTAVEASVVDFQLLPPLMQDFLRYRRCRSFPVVLEPRGVCGPGPGPSPRLLLAVKSQVSNFARRQAIRQSWGGLGRSAGVGLVFLLGQQEEVDGHPRLWGLLDCERRRHGDLLQWGFRDTFLNLTLKEVLFLPWLAQRCPSARFIFKGDDDVFVNTEGLLRFLSLLELGLGLSPGIPQEAGLKPGLQHEAGLKPGLQKGPGLKPGLEQKAGRKPGPQRGPGLKLGLQQKSDLKQGLQQGPGLKPHHLQESGLKQDSGLKHESALKLGLQQAPGVKQGLQQQTGLKLGLYQDLGRKQGSDLKPGLQQDSGWKQGLQNDAGQKQGLQQDSVASQVYDLFIGDTIQDGRPCRDAEIKYYVPGAFYSGLYPPYAGGAGVLYTAHLARRLERASRALPLFPIDDVFMGMCLRSLGLAPTPHPGFYSFGINDSQLWDPCAYRRLLMVHPRSPQENLLIWGMLHRGDFGCD